MVSARLDAFNQQVLGCQKDAFTLAYAMLGKEEMACAVVEKAIAQAYSFWRENGSSIVVEVLKAVLQSCRPMRRRGAWDAVEWIPGWDGLEFRDQETLLLVDVLGKSYSDTAAILKCSKWDVARLIAGARCKLFKTGSLESKQPGNQKRRK